MGMGREDKRTMPYNNLGQPILIMAIVLIVLAGGAKWFSIGEGTLSTAVFVVALILAGAGIYISKRDKDK
ncbi:MAG: hypothetical protein CVV48_09720 [Spirochaetae bacterium HGW-Spirochaetae-4]|jgi:hypothetical protein|nr:MAG: hypothetical protein CVV48_09720 [Spirochaetae bacterium HGW-Spirochaetae-4]